MARGSWASSCPSLGCVGVLFCLYGYLMYVTTRPKPAPPPPCACPVPPEDASHFPEVVGSDHVTQFASGFPHWDDRHLVAYIRQRWLTGPATTPLNLTHPQRPDPSQVGQAAFVDQLLAGRRRGFFVECGAANGETFSNSLFLERERNWTGLLVEADPGSYRDLLTKHRKAFSINACMSPSHRSEVRHFRSAGLFGGLAGSQQPADLAVQCFPLAAMLLALRTTYVDYLSLDVEGPELDVLRSLPFDRFAFQVISVEYRVTNSAGIDRQGTLAKLREVRAFFRSVGIYEEVGILPWPAEGAEGAGLDVIFRRSLHKPMVTAP